MNSELTRDLEAQVDEALRAFAHRCPGARAEGLDELRAGIIALARHHAAKTVHEAVTQRTDRPRKRRCFR
jgi:hypothetical protein